MPRIYYYIISFAFPFLSYAQAVAQQEVGDIVFDKNKDDSSFYLCHQQWIPQYYQAGTTYQGGMNAVRKIFFRRYNNKGIKKSKTQTGYITIRFIVNCKGRTNRFRVYQIDSLYKSFSFDPLISKRLLDITTSLYDWIPGKVQNQNVDTYYYLNFKIIRGELKEVTP